MKIDSCGAGFVYIFPVGPYWDFKFQVSFFFNNTTQYHPWIYPLSFIEMLTGCWGSLFGQVNPKDPPVRRASPKSVRNVDWGRWGRLFSRKVWKYQITNRMTVRWLKPEWGADKPWSTTADLMSSNCSLNIFLYISSYRFPASKNLIQQRTKRTRRTKNGDKNQPMGQDVGRLKQNGHF